MRVSCSKNFKNSFAVFLSLWYNILHPVDVIRYRMKRLYWIGLFVLNALVCRAQYDVAFSNYWALQSFYNPAATGLDGMLNVQGAYSMQMVGFEDAPAVMYVGADLPVFFLSPNHGMGVSFLNDAAGVFSTKKIALQYAYHHNLWGGRISAGLRAALLNQGVDGGDLDMEDANDPAFPTNEETGTAFDLDFGLRYSYKKTWYAGVSVMHLMAPTISLGEEKVYEISINPTFYTTGGYRLPFRNKMYALHMDAAFRTDLLDWRADVTGRLSYTGEKLKMYGGLSYSPTRSATVLLGVNFHGINIGYAYEMYTGGIGALHGTHELVLGYETDLNLFKKGKN